MTWGRKGCKGDERDTAETSCQRGNLMSGIAPLRAVASLLCKLNQDGGAATRGRVDVADASYLQTVWR